MDYAIIEKLDLFAGIALGSWEAVYDLAEKDGNVDASRGELVAESSRGNYVDANKPVALLELENLVIVEAWDALLVFNRNRVQDVKKIVKALENRKREELL